MTLFNSYEKIPDSLKKLNLLPEQMKVLDKVTWAVTEKVHGANFSFIYEASTLRYAKRKDYLEWGDDFFGFQLMASQLDAAIHKLFQRIAQQTPFARCTIYGELFGGAYPHSEVEEDTRVQAIQTGIYYSPTIQFCAFDIALTSLDGSRYYMDYADAITHFEAVGVFYARPLLVGSFRDAMNYNIAFQSVIPQWLGLPALAQDNLAEGVVVKPMREVPLPLRPIVKIKNEKFSEAQFHEAHKWSYLPPDLSHRETLAFLLEEVRCFITANRLDNTYSKIGRPQADDETAIAAIIDFYVDDAMESFSEAYHDLLEEINDHDMVWLKTRIHPEVMQLVQDNLATKS